MPQRVLLASIIQLALYIQPVLCPAVLSAQDDLATATDRMVAVTLAASASGSATDSAANTNGVVAVEGNAQQRVCGAVVAANLPGWEVEGWAAYQRLWRELAEQPEDPTLRQFLGLPIGRAGDGNQVVVKSARGRSAPRWLGWRSGSYRQVETPHLQIFSRADDAATSEVATDLERLFWAWTQWFFPLWEGRPQVALHLRDVPADQTIASVLAGKHARLTPRRKLRIVLLKDAADYARTLGGSIPGIEQSTGFYSDERQTSFFYPSDSVDAVASRRHELVHQLFCEATRSRLSGDSPGTQSEFWLVEGIAGYFESLLIDQNRASVGGWDSPRLQFARYRVLGGRDLIPFSQLRGDGRMAAQKQGDLARWYANAIAYTHAFLDGDSVSDRRWVYGQLRALYDIPVDVPETPEPNAPERALTDYLKVNDAVLKNNPTTRKFNELCLAGCETSSAGLAGVTLGDQCTWLDLSRTAITSADVIRLCPAPAALDQLSLEATAIDDAIHAWIQRAGSLRELDLSWTFCNDETIAAIAGHGQLRTLWLTGSKITDASIPTLIQLQNLESLDVQRTEITPAGLARLKTARPDCKINPLQLR